jgi:carbon monoxide dehydrogenase subunit G
MQLTNEFRVGVPPAQAFTVLTDLERIAPCMPGAQLQEVEGQEYRGVVKVKVGPITAQYKGKAMLIEQDEAAGRAVLRAEGRDTRGQGNANATITASLTPDGDGTKVVVVTDLTVTGKVAQFGRGVLADVSAKLLGQFVDSLEANVLRGNGEATASGGSSEASAAPAETAAAPAAAAATASPAPASATAASAPAETGSPAQTEAAPSAGSSAATGVSSPPSGHDNGSSTPSGIRKIDGPEATPVDLLDAAGASVAKRAIPLVAVVGVVLVFLLWRWRRSS